MASRRSFIDVNLDGFPPAGSFIFSAADFCLEADLADLAATAAALLTTMVRSGSGVSQFSEKKLLSLVLPLD